MTKTERINAGALKQIATLKRVSIPNIHCQVCGSVSFFEVPIHNGESIRIDCAECRGTCNKHWYRKEKRWPKDSGYKWMKHYPCHACRATIGFTKWHGKPMKLKQPMVPESEFDGIGERWWENYQ